LLDNHRKQVIRTIDKEHYPILRSCRWLLLKAEEELDDSKKERLAKILNLSPLLTISHAIKEAMRKICKHKDKEEALKILKYWYDIGFKSDDPIIRKMAQAIQKYTKGILNWYDFHLNTSVLEGINNVIKVLKRRGYGYRGITFFILLLYSLNRDKMK
jgi:transposase